MSGGKSSKPLKLKFLFGTTGEDPLKRMYVAGTQFLSLEELWGDWERTHSSSTLQPKITTEGVWLSKTWHPLCPFHKGIQSDRDWWSCTPNSLTNLLSIPFTGAPT